MILYAAAILFDIGFFALLGTRIAREIRAGRRQENREDHPRVGGK